MLLVHSPSQELPFLNGGYGVDRKIVAYNFFVIVGPASDPAHINGMTNVSLALQTSTMQLKHNSQVQWFSRNDSFRNKHYGNCLMESCRLHLHSLFSKHNMVPIYRLRHGTNPVRG